VPGHARTSVCCSRIIKTALSTQSVCGRPLYHPDSPPHHSTQQDPYDNTQIQHNSTIMAPNTANLEDSPLETCRQIYRDYMYSDFSPQSSDSLVNIFLIRSDISSEYRAEFEFQAQREAARLAQELTTRYPHLDFTVRSPQTFDQAKCLEIEVEMSVGNIANLPELLGTFAREVIRWRTLLHTRTLCLRVVPEHPSRTYPTAANRFQTPELLVVLLGHEVVAKFRDVNQVSRTRGVSEVIVSWDSGMDVQNGWTGLLQFPGKAFRNLGSFRTKASVDAQGLRRVSWRIL